jgi:regulator of protease activity HflC (stomatin/prohibitin superfamily)
MNPITLFLVVVVVVIGGLVAAAQQEPALIAPFLILAAIVALSVKVANVWQRFVVLRAGNFMGVKGPGLFFIFPILDSVVMVIDQRIQTTAFNAEQALTKDTVPVNVDAIIFWRVHDAEKAALQITDYRQAIDRVAQTSLRETIGASMLTQLLSERRAADEQLRLEIARKTESWGVEVMSVEIRDVAIPVALQDAMSRQAQAEREKQARVILGSAEAEVAAKFVEAARTYGGDPMAFQLRAMNIIYETTKERGATILIPSAMVDSMNPSIALALAGRAPPAEPAAPAPQTPRAPPARPGR